MTKIYIVTFTTVNECLWVEKFDHKEDAIKFVKAALSNDEDFFDNFVGAEENDFDYEQIDKDSFKIYQAELIGRPKVNITIEL